VALFPIDLSSEHDLAAIVSSTDFELLT